MITQRYAWLILVGAVVVTALLAGAAAYTIGSRSGMATNVPPPAPVPSVAPVAGAQAADPNTPRMIVIDRNIILRASAAGQAMMSDAEALSTQADAEFRAQAEALQREAAELQQELAILAPDIQAQRQREFTNKQQALQTRIQNRQSQIQNGMARAGQSLDQALSPILQALLAETGANMLVDRSAIILTSLDIDVTATAIERLNAALPTLDVELSATPPEPIGAPAAN